MLIKFGTKLFVFVTLICYFVSILAAAKEILIDGDTLSKGLLPFFGDKSFNQEELRSLKITTTEETVKSDEDSFLKVEPLSDDNKSVIKAELWSRSLVIAESRTYRLINTTGWNGFELKSNPDLTDLIQAVGGGLLEGWATADLIYEHWYNTQRIFCDGRENLCKKLKLFLGENFIWVNQTVLLNDHNSSYWHQVGLFYGQVVGIYAGMQMKGYELDFFDIFMMNMAGDLFDLIDKFSTPPGGTMPRKLIEEGHCSAIIKLLPKNKDLFVAHNSWFKYNYMHRMQKRYHLSYRLTANSTEPVPTRTITFSGYPGIVQSFDDFYILSNNMVVQETTIGNSNATLWEHIKPIGTVLESARVMVANRLATDGSSWCKTFSQLNSGTYNNQWMVVDYNKFQKGKAPKKGLLWVLEQIPGHVTYKEQTNLLKKKKYWPSYNIAFYKDIFKLSGQQDLVDKYGLWFSYDGAPRAKIFKRDQHKIKNLDSLMDFMRYNNFKNDPLSKCDKCKPPYSAAFAIASRKDLNPANGTYPFPFVGHSYSGAYDAKLVDSALVSQSTFIGVAGPSTGKNLPPFVWSENPSANSIPHLGIPDKCNFNPIKIIWSW